MRAKELWQRWRKDFWRLLRFDITGTICSLIHYGIYCFLLFFTSITIAYTTGYGVRLPCNYGFAAYFTLKGRLLKSDIAGFAGGHTLSHPLEIGLLHIPLWLGVSRWLPPILVMMIVVPINFILLWLIFAKGKKEHG